MEKAVKFNISYDQHGVLRSTDVGLSIKAEDENDFSLKLEEAVNKLFASSSIRLDDSTWSKINVLQVAILPEESPEADSESLAEEEA